MNSNEPASRGRDDRPRDESELLRMLGRHQPQVPPSIQRNVMASLPDRRATSLWHAFADSLALRRSWLTPAFAGACATLIAVSALGLFLSGRPSTAVTVTFVLRAPDAGSVELVGSFNGWKRGEIVLQGPDPSGTWSASVELPAGRHEYLFLVDGREWVTDPAAISRRPDGFGRENAVIEIFQGRDAV